MKKLILLLLVLFQCVFAQSFDFNSKGQDSANKILKDYILSKYEIDDDFDTIAFSFEDKIIGIVKLNAFYSLEGYKLIVLKKNENGFEAIKSNVFFDNSKILTVDNNKITYYKSVFYKNKKCNATIKNDEVKSLKSINDTITDRKVQNIEHLTRHVKNENVNNLELSDFKVNSQKKVNIRYNNLNDRTRHYLEMK